MMTGSVIVERFAGNVWLGDFMALPGTKWDACFVDGMLKMVNMVRLSRDKGTCYKKRSAAGIK